MRLLSRIALPFAAVLSALPLLPATAATAVPREAHLADVIQLTHGGQNAEAYWSPDGRQLIFQSTRPPYACDQIFRLPADGSGTPALISTGKGRTTCSYFTPDGSRVLFSSTHAAGDACPPPPDRSQGYVWAVYPSYEIWTAKPDGSDLQRLTDNSAYDAETTVCPKDGSLIFTSDRDGDLELYRMDADGKNVKRLTHAPGYDGGAYFSPDCQQIVWRASRPEGTELDDYKKLLARGLVRPGKLEIWLANADGSEARQLTYLNAASFAPSFFPDGKRVIFSSNYGDPAEREFELWAVNTDGTGLERITDSPGFDGFPMFSPDGTRLAFASNRNNGAPHETNVFVARWQAGTAAASTLPETAGADRFAADVRWLADDAREGRGIGTAGLAAAERWLADRFHALGLEPAGDDGTYFHHFAVPVAVAVEPATAVTIDGTPLDRSAFQPAGFSASGEAAGPVVAAGWGIVAPTLGVDDYKGLDVHGKIVVVRRFTPKGGGFTGEAERRYGDLRSKAFTAREHGASGLVVVDLPAAADPQAGKAGDTLPEDAPLPKPALDAAVGQGGDAGIPVVFVTRAAGGALFGVGGGGGGGEHRASLHVRLTRQMATAANVVGRLAAAGTVRLPGAVLVGAHYDHLGRGGAGSGSLTPDSHAVHHGADDNASGTAGVLEIARLLAAERDRLQRDVYFVAFSGEESGVLGSTALIRQPPAGWKIADLVAMLNLDMVGRLRGNQLAVLGTESAEEWKQLVPPACAQERLACTLSGDGYGPSDHSPFYAAGVPVLHFFTGAHEDYHKPADTADKINAIGGARVARLVADLAREVADRPAHVTYKSAPAPAPQGDARSYGASLGTIPDYAGDGRPGVLIGSVRPEGAAAKAGLQRGDLLVELAGTPIRDIYDFMYVLRQSKPGQTTQAVVDRGGKRITVTVTFGASTAVR
ncbi:MAG TPA: M20/M25/M40 family metallo-hydrolase [Thermoanaerobaculia bacterium]|nr:M20/M25/M40 family metallo-hydrolase [Thermoanaerobaculia bacterium]